MDEQLKAILDELKAMRAVMATKEDLYNLETKLIGEFSIEEKVSKMEHPPRQ